MVSDDHHDIYDHYVWQIILNYSDFLSQIRLTQVCSHLHTNLKITDFHNISYEYLNRLNDTILKNYPHIIKLNAGGNLKITDVNHMANLQVLNASWYSGIGDNGIKNLNLVELRVYNNLKITDVNHMTNLQILDASRNCGISNNGIKDLNLVKLDVSNNPKITDVNHMTNLQILYACCKCGISDDGIKNLNLVKLIAWYNPKITKRNFLFCEQQP